MSQRILRLQCESSYATWLGCQLYQPAELCFSQVICLGANNLYVAYAFGLRFLLKNAKQLQKIKKNKKLQESGGEEEGSTGASQSAPPIAAFSSFKMNSCKRHYFRASLVRERKRYLCTESACMLPDCPYCTPCVTFVFTQRMDMGCCLILRQSS